jgi:hypothetical protein
MAASPARRLLVSFGAVRLVPTVSAVALALSSAAQASPQVDGVWNWHGYSCSGAGKCTKSEFQDGSSRLVGTSLRFVVKGGRVCGAWEGGGSKLYEGWLRGQVVDQEIQFHYGQEQGHNPAFYEAKHYEDLPRFVEDPQKHFAARRRGKRLVVRNLAQEIQEVYVFKRDSKSNAVWGSGGPESWGRRFVRECLNAG